MHQTLPVDLPGWTHVAGGKVRDIYAPEGAHPLGDVVLIVASDRISAFDHVLATPIPDKGRVLTQLTAWWFEQLAGIVPNHQVSLDVPDAVHGRGMIARRLDMVPVECVARGYLTGSGLAEYRQTGEVCGIRLAPGLVDGSRLAPPIFTPATKAAIGDHDENVSFEVVAASIGQARAAELRDLTLSLYRRAEEIARERGILLADTKFEFGLDPATGEVVLGDEVLTPDSSRFWAAATWAPGGPQPSFDKQCVRDWLAHDSGWDRRSDAPPPPLPDTVVDRTRDRYLDAYERLTGHRLP
ncbi:MAG: phosphoribosylaminoimidazolesuccinocarboxamide synthase [Bifidobacteriaceae bacterium]|nr:phosphoribosylaminoimidazolesuccinocarboxamide synthase [Bifidobacteriaceae bacterium]